LHLSERPKKKKGLEGVDRVSDSSFIEQNTHMDIGNIGLTNSKIDKEISRSLSF
jgi:hypothetical protein